MRISLSEETRSRIREVLGNDVDLAPDVVPSVLARLAVEAPAVYSQVLEEISGSQIRLDSEGEIRRRQRRGVLRRIPFRSGGPCVIGALCFKFGGGGGTILNPPEG